MINISKGRAHTGACSNKFMYQNRIKVSEFYEEKVHKERNYVTEFTCEKSCIDGRNRG